MGALPSSTTVCRVLLGLDRAQASGALRLRGEGRAATVSFERGRVVGANVDRRVSSSSRQLFEGLVRICGWDHLVLRFVQEPHATPWWKVDEPVPARVLALSVMQATAAQVTAPTMRADLGRGFYHLTKAGEALVHGAKLRPEERAVLGWLRRGVCADDVPLVAGCGLRGYRFVWVLKLLRAAAPKGGGSYPLLLRKRCEVRRHVSARALLDLPEGAGGSDARKALRKLVREIHPDRFGGSVPVALRRASGEIVAELVNAEAAIAAGRSE